MQVSVGLTTRLASAQGGWCISRPSRQQGLACAELVIRTVRGEIRPVQAIEKPPLALNILCQGTAMEPMRTFLGAARALEREPGMLSAAIGEGFPYADVPHLGMAFVAISDGDPR